MPISIKHIDAHPNPIVRERWDELLKQMPSYSFFQTPQWTEILQAAIPGSSPMHRLFRFSDEAELALPMLSLPKRFGMRKLEALPWGAYGGVVGNGIDAEHLHLAAQACVSFWKPMLHFHISPQSEPSCQEVAQTIERFHLPFQIQQRSTHILPLASTFEETAQAHFQSRNRTSLRKAGELKLIVEWNNSQTAVEQCKTMYHAAARDWDEEMQAPDELFDQLAGRSGDEIRFWTVSDSETVLGMNLILYGKKQALYFTGARNTEKSNPMSSKWLMAEILRDACERGYESMNFGASGGIGGVEQFKELFGGKKTDYCSLVYAQPWLKALFFK